MRNKTLSFILYTFSEGHFSKINKNYKAIYASVGFRKIQVEIRGRVIGN